MTALLLSPHVKRKWSARAEALAVEILDSSGVTDAIVPTVYGLTDSEGAIRYVGGCANGLGYRLTRHVYYAMSGKDWRISEWLRESDYDIGIVVLALNPENLRATELEWIHRLNENGDLLNYCGAPTSDAQKRAASAANHRRFSDPAARARVGELSRGRIVSDATRAKLSAAATGRTHSPESRAKMSAARKGIPKSEETKARMRAAQARRWGGG